jgi:WD40 repeat protein
MLVWQAHKSKIESAAFSPDGRFLATATGGTRTVYLWKPTTGKLVRKLGYGQVPDRRAGSIKSVAFAPEAPLLAAGAEHCIIVWRTGTWEVLAYLDAACAHELAFGPGQAPLLAAASADQLTLWADPGLPTGGTVRSPDRSVPPNGGVASLHFSPDGKLLARSTPWIAMVWNPVTAEVVRTLREGNVGNRGAVQFSPDGRRIAMAYAKWVEIRSVANDSPPPVKVQAGTGRFPIVWAVSWTTDGRSFLTAGNDGLVKLWDADTGAEMKSYSWDIGRLYCAAFSPDGLTCAACGERGQIVVWDVDV